MKPQGLQLVMFNPETDWVPPSELPDITDRSEIAIDLETRDPNIKTLGPGWPRGDGEVVGYAIAVDGWSGYLPVGHQGGGNLDKRIVHNWMKKVLACPADKIMHNAQYDLGWLKAEGFEVNGNIVDTMVVAALLDENRFSFSLNSVCYDHLNKTKSEKGLVEAAKSFGLDPKADMWKMPAMFVGEYATADAELTLELWKYFKVQIQKEGLTTVFELERDLLPCLVDMTLRGIRVDLDGIERASQFMLKEEKAALKNIKSLTGFDVEIWAAKSIADAFDKLGIPYPKTDKGAPSFTKSFLTTHDHELAKSILQAREYNKSKNTFMDGLLKHVGKDGRIHGHINQIRSDDGGTVSGRISMSNPNLQQIPARHPDLGPMIRSVFLPEEGHQWASIDYSQQEPRILVHFAASYQEATGLEMSKVDDFVYNYTHNPDTDFHDMVATMADIPRKQAKTINLGMMYGMGVGKLADQLDLSKDEAKEIMTQYDHRVPFVKKLMRAVQDRVQNGNSEGSIRSLLGRKCRFPHFEPKTFGMHKAMTYEEARAHYGPNVGLQRAYAYKALNRLIQASAADMTKKAMVDLYKEGILPLLQVHDELAFSVESEDEAKKLAEIMCNAIELKVPMKTDIELGPSWGGSM
jgi:DNA polymerase I-like protein with 3'-5' exonuclease and polymerase domains